MMKNIKVIINLLIIPIVILLLLFGVLLGTGDLNVIMFIFISLVVLLGILNNLDS